MFQSNYSTFQLNQNLIRKVVDYAIVLVLECKELKIETLCLVLLPVFS